MYSLYSIFGRKTKLIKMIVTCQSTCNVILNHVIIDKYKIRRYLETRLKKFSDFNTLKIIYQ